LSAIAESNLSHSSTVRIRITQATKEKVRLAIRKPTWADSVQLGLTGPGSMSSLQPGYVAAEKVWAAGELIEVKYGIKLRSENSGNDRQSFWYGPWLLGASAADNAAYFNELTVENRLLAAPASIRNSGAERVFSVPIAASETAYSQAEYPDQPGHVSLRAIAEQTGQPTTSWELRFLMHRNS